MSENKVTINYKGQTLVTKHHKPMSDSMFLELKEQYYAKPQMKHVRNEVRDIFLRGNVTMRKINDYYFKDLMAKVRLYHSYWCIEDVFNHKPLLESFYSKTFSNLDVYPAETPMIKKIETAFRIGGKGVASKPTNFRLDQTIEIIKKYNLNDNYYDPSCGWGVRLVGSLATGVNYFGTDPNYELVERLKTVADLFKEVDLFAPECDIRAQGSERFVPEWENKIGLVFTSPPYFFLEDYRIGEQSTKNFSDYQEWLEKYMLKTFENAYRYMISGAYILININDYDKYTLENDTQTMLKRAGFEYVATETFDNITRINSNGIENENNENIFVFKKP